MRLGINLRGDLAKLDVQALSDRFDLWSAERDAVANSLTNFETIGNKWLYQKGYGMPFGRGILHTPIIYRLAGIFYGGSSQKGLGRLYIIDCELKDIVDESRRRLCQLPA